MSVAALKEVILPAAFSKDGVKFISCLLDSQYKGGDQFQSNVVFVSVIVEEGEVRKNISLVVKFEPSDKKTQQQLKTYLQFHNEIFMYSKLLPEIDKYDTCAEIFPTFYYGISKLTAPEDDVVVIEDLRAKGYKLAEHQQLDFEHLKLALEKLGKFHALSYIAKKTNTKQFFKLVANLRESSWVDGAPMTTPTVVSAFHRALDPLIASGKHSAVLSKLLSRVDDSVVKFLLELVSSDEPLAVLCHGDFCRNNMLFKYDAGKAVDVRFFDVATARYASPVIDIAFFLFMNCSKEMRSAHWDDFLELYHNSLTSTLGGIEGPSLQQLKEEMKHKGVYGFVHASFFLPLMIFDNDFSSDDFVKLTPDEIALKVTKVGGEEGTMLMMEMVEELIDRDILTLDHSFLKNL